MLHIDGKAKKETKLEVDGGILEVLPLGAGCEVGRSCIVARFKGKCVMFDCGIHPGHSGIGALPVFDAINVSDVDLCLVTHFHLDHCGAVPYFLNKTDFRGRMFMTEATKAVCQILWYDYGRVSQNAEGGGATGGRGSSKLWSTEGSLDEASRKRLYNEAEISLTMERCETVDFHQEMEVNGIKFCAFGAGHVLGACMFLIEIGGVRILYTGDYSREEDRHLPRAEIPQVHDVHLLICEGTFGIKVHEERKAREKRFLTAITTIVARGGKCLLPAFALGRAQELLMMIDEHWQAHPELQHVPVWYASPIALKSMRIFETFINLCGKHVKAIADSGRDPFRLNYVRAAYRIDDIKEAIYSPGACVVMAAPGMLQSGTSREIFEAWAADRRNGVILTGCAVKGTLAHELRKEQSWVQIGDRQISVGCSFDNISFSAHSDFNQTWTFISELRAPNVVLVHGERSELFRLREKLQELRPSLAVFAPDILQTVRMTFPSNICAVAVGRYATRMVGAAKLAASSTNVKAETDALSDCKMETDSLSDVHIESSKPQTTETQDDSMVVNPLIIVDSSSANAVVVHPDDVVSLFPAVSISEVTQTLKIAFPYSIDALEIAIKRVYEETERINEPLVALCICRRVVVWLRPEAAKKGSECDPNLSGCAQIAQVLYLQWEPCPIADIIGDSVVYLALTIREQDIRSASACNNASHSDPQQESQLVEQHFFNMVKDFLGLHYAPIYVIPLEQPARDDVMSRLLSKDLMHLADDQRVAVQELVQALDCTKGAAILFEAFDIASSTAVVVVICVSSRTVNSKSKGVADRVRAMLRRLESSFFPIAPF